jgi:T1SS-143 domain-containing protein
MLTQVAAGLVSANAAAQVQVDVAMPTEPVVLAQATPPTQGVAAAMPPITAGKLIGTVTEVVGEAKATAPDGTVRILQVGDKVFADEVIMTGPGGDVKIAVASGSGGILECGPDSSLALHEGMLGGGAAAAAQPDTTTPAATQAPGDVAAIQQAIAAGADPTQVAQATAAGGAPGAGGAEGGGSHEPVVLNQANTSGDVTSGFNTQGASIQFPTPEFNLVPTEEQPTVSVSVQVSVEVEPTPGENPVPVDGSLGVGAANVIEGTGEAPKTVNFIISLDKVFATDVTVTYTLQGGTATAFVDFTEGDGQLTHTVTIPAGETTMIVPVQIVQDSAIENNETFSIVLNNAVGATVNPEASSATVTILDDDLLAVADSNWAKEDSDVTIDGNVLAGANHSPDDTRGADPSASINFSDAADLDTAADTTGLAVNSVNGSAANVGAAIAGTYGSLTLNADGTYTYVLNNANPTVQALDDGESVSEAFVYTAVNGFGNTSSSTLEITIFGTNDAPEITAELAARISEEGLQNANQDSLPNTALDTTDSASASGQFVVSDTDIEALTVTLNAPANGNITSNGADVEWALSNSGHTLTGTAGESAIVTITIDNSGNYTVTLSGPIDHPDTETEDTFGFNVTVTVSDGTATANGTLTVTVEDDSPVISVGEREFPSLAVDETDLSANDTADFSGVFSSSAGADGQQSLTYSLDISADGVNSGVVDTTTGQNIVLTLNGNVVEGHVGTTAGALAFTVTVNSATGVVTLDQIRAVVHPDGTDPDTSEAVSLSSGVVALTATIVDSDGDRADTSIDLGHALNFLDDGPSIDLADLRAPTLTVDETNLAANDTADFSGVFTSDAGADGQQSITYTLGISANGVDSGVVDTLTGQNIVLRLNGGVVEGRVGTTDGTLAFTVSINGNTGEVTLDQIRAVIHDIGSDPDTSEPVSLTSDVVTLTATIVDKDGDSDAAVLNLGDSLTFRDDGPTIDADAATIVVDEDGLTGGLAGNGTGATGDVPGADVALSGNLSGLNFGADGAGDIVLGTSANIGFSTLSGNAIETVWDGGTHTLTGRDSVTHDAVFTLKITDVASGSGTFTLLAPVQHTVAGVEDDQSFNVTVTVVDKDGDSTTGTIAVTIDDDTPVASDEPARELSEGGTVTGVVDFMGGADGALVTSVSGHEVAAEGDTTIHGSFGTLVIDAQGNYSYTANDSVIGSPTDTFTFTVTDGDGDPVTKSMAFNVLDANTPLLSDTAVTLDEEGLGGNAGSTLPGDVAGESVTFSGTLVDFSYGADGQGATGNISIADNLNTGVFTLDGTEVAATWNQGTSTLTGMAGDVKVFDLVIDQTDGDYTITLYQPVQHPTAGEEDDVSLNVTVTVTDADGSTNTGDFTLTIDDDSPVVTSGSAAADVLQVGAE